MISALEHIGNALSGVADDSEHKTLATKHVAQWVAVVNAVANHGDIESAVRALDARTIGSDIVRLAGSLRNEEVVKYISLHLNWNELLHNDQTPTSSRSRYNSNSCRHRLLSDLTEHAFWIRQFGSDCVDENTFDNIAFVFHTAVNHGAMSFQHPVHSTLFGRCVPFGTAVLAQQLGEQYYIFEGVPFTNIAQEDHADFFIAGCLHMGAREDHLNPEERTLGEGRLDQLIDTMSAIDVNALYAPSDYMCHALGWPSGTQCPLGMVGLAILAASPIRARPTVSFAQRVLNSLTLDNKQSHCSLLCDALLNTTSWKTSMGQEPFGPINSLVVEHLMSLDASAVRSFVLDELERFASRSSQQQDVFRHLLVQASRTASRAFSLDDAPTLLSGLVAVFDVLRCTSSTEWSALSRWRDWWHESFDNSLQWFDYAAEEKVRAFMEPYLVAMAGAVISSRNDEQRMQSTLMLETFNPVDVCVEPTPRKLKL